MVLILLSWLYVFFTSIAIGIGFSRLFKLTSLNIVVTSILGLFGVTLFAGCWAMFGPINVCFHIFLLLVSMILGYCCKTDLVFVIKTVRTQFSTFSLSIKLLLGVTSACILAQSATLPFIVDNETYYIQTIKWLNEYGYVPGLANLHLFLGQTSGWHIAQSVYSLSFLYERFNDLNGYLLLMVNFWAFQKLHAYFTANNRLDLIFGLLPLTYIFLFQFISAPSPDLPVYLIGFIVFSLYLEIQQDFDLEKFNLIAILVLFAVFIKITAIVLLALPLLLLVKHIALLKNQMVRLQLLGGFVVFLFAVKNIMLTGYPFYPLTVWPDSSANYTVPKEIVAYFFSREMMHSFYMGFGAFQDASILHFFKQYFLYSGINSIIGLTTLVLIIISPLMISKYYPKQKIYDLYFVFIILLFLLVISSPQYRFYAYFTIFFGLVCLSIVLTNRKLIVGLLSFSAILTGILVLVPMSFNGLTSNESLANNTTFSAENLVQPKPNSKMTANYSMFKEENLKYYSPTDYSFFWMTGNGNLPCVNKEQLDYFKTNFQVIPQLRGKTLSEGFFAKKTKGNE